MIVKLIKQKYMKQLKNNQFKSKTINSNMKQLISKKVKLMRKKKKVKKLNKIKILRDKKTR